MSLNQQHLSLEIIKGEETRKIDRLPATWNELVELLINLFGTANFRVSYVDEEGDQVTISDTEQLLDVYEQFQPRIKLFLREHQRSKASNKRFPTYSQEFEQSAELREFVRAYIDLAFNQYHFPKETVLHEGVSCNRCEACPLSGARYKCTVCEDFDLCSACEKHETHDHPFMKIANPACISSYFGGRGQAGRRSNQAAGYPQFLKNIIGSEGVQNFLQSLGVQNLMGQRGAHKKGKLKVAGHSTLSDYEPAPLDVPLTKIWQVKNIGNSPVPAGATLVCAKGQIEAVDEPELPEIPPNATVEIEATIMLHTLGKNIGHWLVMKDNKKFGKLKVKLVAIDCPAEAIDQVKEVMKTGCSAEEGKTLLEAANWDTATASMLFIQTKA